MKLNKRGYFRDETFLFFAMIFVVIAVTFWFVDDSVIRAGYAVADCVDDDSDNYFDENCVLTDLGCTEETAFVSDASNQVNVDAGQDYIVYKDDSSGAWQVYIYDLNSGTSSLLSSSEISLNPRISEPYIVWQGYDSGVWNIYLYDLTTGSSSVVSTSLFNQVAPDVSSSGIVWSDQRSGEWDIYGFNFVTGVEQAMITDSGNQIAPKIYGNYVVYVDDSAGNQNVYLYDVTTGTKTQVSSGSSKDNAADVNSMYIVWESLESGTWDIYVYDIASGVSSAIASSSSEERLPKISENLIAWMQDDDIYYYDFEQGVVSAMINDDYVQRTPAVYGNVVYWLDYRNGNWDIYGKVANPSCDVSILGDCDDSDSLVNPGAEEICDDLIDNDCDGEIDCDGVLGNETEIMNETVDYECTIDGDCESGNYCSGGYCIVETLDCGSEWDCSNVEWGNCEGGISVRDLSLCAIQPSGEECYNEEYLPESEMECVEDEGALQSASVNEDVPVFTWLNLVLVVSILIGFYLVKLKKSN